MKAINGISISVLFTAFTRFALRLTFAAVLTTLALVIFACSTIGSKTSKMGEGPNSGGFLDAPTDYRLEIGGLQIPAGVSSDTFELMKAELLRQLDARFDGDPSRATSGAPQDGAGKVDSLAYVIDGLGAHHVTWNYANKGDYDLSGEVGVPDITPVALNYLVTPPTIGGDPYLHWIDGDGSGEIGIPDITPIALGYLNSVAGYQILGSSNALGPWDVIATVDFPSNPEFPVTFDYEVDPFDVPDYLAVRPIDGDGGTGIVSNVVAKSGNQIPTATITPSHTVGEAPLTISFDAGSSFDPDGMIAKFEWDFEGDGIFDQDTGVNSSIDHEYMFGGIFNATVRVTDNLEASATAFVVITLSGAVNIPPVAHIISDQVNTNTGIFVNFDASLSDDPDGSISKFEWDFNGDGTYDLDTLDTAYSTHAFDTAGIYQVYVRVTDNGGSSATDSITINVTQNDSPIALFYGYQGGGGTTTSAGFNASASYDPDGEIVSFDFDWTSDGTYDFFSGINPIVSNDYGENGTFNVTLRVTDNLGATATAQFLIDISAPNTWNIVFPLGGAGEQVTSKLALIGGKPGIAYYNYTDASTMYIAATDPFGAAWGTEYEVSADRGVWTDLIQANGMPCVAFESSSGFTKYVRATAIDGSSWQTEVQADVNGSGRHLSMGFIYTTGTFPAIASANWEDDKLYFATASNINGDAWNGSVVVDSGVGECYPSLYYVSEGSDKYPAIAYYDRPNQDLKFVKANDTAGSSWGTPVVVDSEVGEFYFSPIVLAQVDGFPVIFYYDVTNFALVLAVASDTAGSTWGNLYPVTSWESPTTRSQDFAIVDGSPCAVYTIANGIWGDEFLVYRKLTGLGLGDWGPVETIDTGGTFTFVSLTDVNGIPGVSYIDASAAPTKLKYAYATTS